MVQCEMCGAETPSPNTVKVEGAELDVCGDCADFGTEVRTQETSTTSTKYSTSSSSSSGGGTATNSTGGSRSGGSGGRRPGSDIYDDVEELAADYDDRIRHAREGAGLSQEDLAKRLNEKASLIRKLERGEMLPSDDIQTKLERSLDVSLTESVSDEDDEWTSDSSTGEFTLGDVVERKD